MGYPTWTDTHMISSKHLQWIRDFANGTPPAGLMLFPERLWKARLLDPLLPHPSLLNLYERCSHAQRPGEQGLGDHQLPLPSNKAGRDSPFPCWPGSGSSVSQEHGVVLVGSFQKGCDSL